ncbi:MAG: (Fe-S)-binding protein [Vulcanimicrobiaceae bacterium]
MVEGDKSGFHGSDAPLASMYDACVRCGLCLPSCPTYLETMTETSGPRGRISLIKAVAEGQLDLLSPGFVEQMSQCLDCRACEAACPSGVRYGSLLERSRAQIETALAPTRPAAQTALRRFALRTLFSNLATLRIAARILRWAQRSGLMWIAERSGFRTAAGLAPRIPGHFFIPNGQRFDAQPSLGLAFLHTGCIMQVAFPNVHEASLRMLRRAGLSVTVPRAQGCCGAIAVHTGQMAFGRELAKCNIEAFERSGADVYVVNAAGCGSTLKEYGDLLRDDPQWCERAERFSSRVRDITEVLDAMQLDSHIGRIDAVVTYQEPCHLVHAQRVSAAPRRLLAQIPGLLLREMDESAVCCGSAGIYNLTQPEMAQNLQRRKVAHIVETAATIVATANPGCALQVAAGLRERDGDVRVAHIVELLDEAYANYNAAATRA